MRTLSVEGLSERSSHNSQATPYLSPEELVYAKEYAESLDKHYGSLLLRHMPESLQKIDKKKAGMVSLVTSR